MQGNKVFMKGHDVIEINVVGDQTVASVDTMGEEVMLLAEHQRALGKPVLVLDELSRMGAVPPDARQRVVDLARKYPIDKLAMVGHNDLLRIGANLMLRATGKHDHMRYFDDYDAALEWLRA